MPRHSPQAGPRAGAAAASPPRRRFARLLALPVVALGLAACGSDHYHDGCNPAYFPAVAVHFVDARDNRRIAVSALGTIYDGRYLEEMTSPESGYSVNRRTTVLEGAFGRTGIFDVVIETASGERFEWPGVRVAGDYCGPYTVELQAAVRYPEY